MRQIVVTRPLQQATPWIDALRQIGLPVVHVPLLRILPLEDVSPIQKAWAHMNKWQWVMFVSSNAVHYFFQCNSHPHNPTWPLQLRAGAVGKGTAQALTNWGVPIQLIDQPAENQLKDSESLWQNIANRSWKNAHVLLVRGISTSRSQRDWLMNQLQKAGAYVNSLTVYERACVPLNASTQAWLASDEALKACWLFSSSEALGYLPKQNWAHAIAIATHPRIAKAAHQAGFGQVVCTEPDLHSVLDSVKSVV